MKTIRDTLRYWKCQTSSVKTSILPSAEFTIGKLTSKGWNRSIKEMGLVLWESWVPRVPSGHVCKAGSVASWGGEMGGWPVGIRTKKACNLILEAGQSTGGKGQLQRNRPKRHMILLGEILRGKKRLDLAVPRFPLFPTFNVSLPSP